MQHSWRIGIISFWLSHIASFIFRLRPSPHWWCCRETGYHCFDDGSVLVQFLRLTSEWSQCTDGWWLLCSSISSFSCCWKCHSGYHYFERKLLHSKRPLQHHLPLVSMFEDLAQSSWKKGCGQPTSNHIVLTVILQNGMHFFYSVEVKHHQYLCSVWAILSSTAFMVCGAIPHSKVCKGLAFFPFCSSQLIRQW